MLKILRVHLCAELTAASWMLEPFGEVSAIFHYNTHREHSLLKLKRKISQKHKYLVSNPIALHFLTNSLIIALESLHFFDQCDG